MTTATHPVRQSTFRGVTDADCLRQAEADVVKARAAGYEIASQSWADDSGVRVLVVTYRFTGMAPAPTKSGPSLRSFVLFLFVAILIIGAVGAWQSGSLSLPTVISTSPDIPPVGRIWFGSSFDAGTFQIRGRTTTVGTHDPFSFVAHLTRTVNGADLVMRISLNGQLITTGSTGGSGFGDVWGFTPGPLFEPGEWKYEMTDIGGNVLAAGTVTAT